IIPWHRLPGVGRGKGRRRRGRNRDPRQAQVSGQPIAEGEEGATAAPEAGAEAAPRRLPRPRPWTPSGDGQEAPAADGGEGDGGAGTCATLPQLLQITSNIWRPPPPAPAPPPALLEPRRIARQSGQRPGSFCRPLEA